MTPTRPGAIFTDPELVSVGLTEARPARRATTWAWATSGFSGGKARAWGQERGPGEGGRRPLDPPDPRRADPGLPRGRPDPPVVVAMQAGSAEPLLDAFHIHPTLGEIVQKAARTAVG